VWVPLFLPAFFVGAIVTIAGAPDKLQLVRHGTYESDLFAHFKNVRLPKMSL
jgi:hypothetical protein